MPCSFPLCTHTHVSIWFYREKQKMLFTTVRFLNLILCCFFFSSSYSFPTRKWVCSRHFIHNSPISNTTIVFLCQYKRILDCHENRFMISIKAWSLLYYHLIKCHFNWFVWVSICFNLCRLPHLFSLLSFPISSSRVPFQRIKSINLFVSKCSTDINLNLHVCAVTVTAAIMRQWGRK